MSKVEMIAAELIKNFQQKIQRKKNSIIDELRSSEINLTKHIKQNPKLWNKECLDIKIDRSKADKINVGLSAVITVNRPNVMDLSALKNESLELLTSEAERQKILENNARERLIESIERDIGSRRGLGRRGRRGRQNDCQTQ